MSGKKRFILQLVVFAVVALVCLGYVFLHRGDLASRPTYLIESTSEITFGENGQTLVIDNGKKTLLVLDGDGQLVSRYDGGSDDAPFYYACYAVQTSDGSIYVADIKYGDRGNLLDWERIIRLNGKESEVLYNVDYTLWAVENTPLQYGRILELQAYEGGYTSFWTRAAGSNSRRSAQTAPCGTWARFPRRASRTTQPMTRRRAASW